MRGKDRIEIGGVARAHGIAGEIVVVTHDPESTVLESADELWLSGQSHRILRARGTQRGWLMLLEGVTTRTQAETLRGATVEVARELVPLEPGEFLLDDLIGCQVVLPDGRPWGVVAGIELDFQDRMVIHDGGVERLLPVVPECVVQVDLEAGKVVVDPPEGIPEMRITASDK